jgi:DNA-binding MarR family transcriptional regulator
MSREHNISALWRNLLDMNRQLKLTLQAMNANNQLNNSMIAVIFQLENQSMKMNDIADYLGITLGAATSLVDKLERLAIVERIRSAEDRRIINVQLTAEGRQTLASLREQFAKEAILIFKDTPDQELEVWNAELNRIQCFLMQYNQNKTDS